jgi:hypothetical protein
MRWATLTFVVGMGVASVAHAAGRPCSLAWRPFGDGSVSCQSGRQFRCVDGSWQPVGTSCAGEEQADSGLGVRPEVEQPAVQQPAVVQPAVPRAE